MCPDHLSRRTVLTTIAALASATLASSSAAARGENDRSSAGRCVGVDRRGRARSGRSSGPANRPGASLAVVDRIVDGRFVVLLLEEEGQIVDQLVVPREELPTVEEGDVLLVAVEEGELRKAQVLVGETKRRRRWSADRLDCLRMRVD